MNEQQRNSNPSVPLRLAISMSLLSSEIGTWIDDHDARIWVVEQRYRQVMPDRPQASKRSVDAHEPHDWQSFALARRARSHSSRGRP